MALGPRGEIWIVECKSSRVDFVSDLQVGRLSRLVRPLLLGGRRRLSRPTSCPPDAGLILADAYDAEIQRWPEPVPLPGARRRALTQRFARTAAGRLGQLTDPDPFPRPAVLAARRPRGAGRIARAFSAAARSSSAISSASSGSKSSGSSISSVSM